MFPVISFSQNTNYSPYSRFGLGEFILGRTVSSYSMGNVSLGINNSSCINSQNPASYSAIDSLSFLFDLAVSSRISNIRWTDQSATYSNTNIQYFTAGFPITRWWRSAFGLQPYSTVGYNLQSVQTLNDSVFATHTYTGNGGLNQFFLGNSFKLFKNFSFGFNTSFLFGSLDRKTVSKLSGINYASEYRNTQSIIIQDFAVTFGIQYKYRMKNKDLICAGIVFDNKTPLNTRVSDFTYKYLNISGILTLDTLEDEMAPKSTIDMPLHTGIGFSYNKPNYLTVALDFRYFNRSNAFFLGVQDSLGNSVFTGAGAEYIPQYNSPNKYWRRVAYRAGMYYYSSGLELKNSPINQAGISIGLGLPLRRSRTMINISVEACSRGTLKNDLIREQYFVISAGMLLYDKWFVKPKYE